MMILINRINQSHWLDDRYVLCPGLFRRCTKNFRALKKNENMHFYTKNVGTVLKFSLQRSFVPFQLLGRGQVPLNSHPPPKIRTWMSLSLYRIYPVYYSLVSRGTTPGSRPTSGSSCRVYATLRENHPQR